MLLRVCPSSFFYYLRPLHLFSFSATTAKFPFCPSLRREFRLSPSRSSSSFRRMESLPASSSSPTPVTDSAADSLAKDLQNQTLGAVDEAGDAAGNIKRKLEDFNWDHSFVKELPGDPRSDVISREVEFLCVFFPFSILSGDHMSNLDLLFSLCQYFCLMWFQSGIMKLIFYTCCSF